MKLNFVRIAGFRGVRNEMLVNFPDGFAVIAGANGAGKSTVCDAIEFAICGNVNKFPGSSESGEGFQDYLWWRGKNPPKERFVILGIRRDDGSEIEIRRGPGGLHGLREEQIAEIFCDPSERGSFDPPKLCQTSILRGEQLAELSLDLPEVERFKFVKSALGTRDLSNLEIKAEEASKHFRNLATAFQQDYERTRSLIARVTSEMSAAASQVAEAGDLAAAEASVRQITGIASVDSAELIPNARRELVRARSAVQSLERLITRLVELQSSLAAVETPDHLVRVSEISTALASLRERRSKLETEAASLEAKIGQHQASQPLLESWAQLRHFGEKLDLQDGKCPLCASTVSPAHFQTHLRTILDFVTKENSALSQLVEQRSKVGEQVRGVANEILVAERRFTDLSGLPQKLRGDQKDLYEEAAKLLNSPPSGFTIDVLRTEFTAISQKISSLERALNTLESSRTMQRVSALKKQLEELRKQSDTTDKTILRINALAERYRETAATLKRISGEVIDERLAQLSPLLRELYSRLRPHVDWTEISYLIRGDVRRFLSLRVGDELNPKFIFSNGQRRAAGLAFLLAVHLSRGWCCLNSLVLDDPVQHIDDFRALHLVEVLSAIRKSGRQVICTVEDEALAQLLSRRLGSREGEDGALISMAYQPNEGVVITGRKTVSSPQKLSVLAA